MYNYPMELYHFGVIRRSGRYPYGSGERPYQGERSKTVSSKDKKNMIKQGDAKSIKKHRSDFSDDELRNALNRLDLYKKLDGYANVNSTTLFDTFDLLIRRCGKMNNWFVVGTTAYRNVKRILDFINQQPKKSNRKKSDIIDVTYNEI